MLSQALSTLLPLLLWGGLTGIINLAFGYRSQIEAWSESRPNVAALLKFSRAVGLDPWNILSAIKLAATSKLPDAQKANSPVAKSEQRKADKRALDEENTVNFGPPLLVLVFVGFCLSQQACHSAPPCNEDKLRAMDAAYLADIAKACLPKYDVAEECPDYAPLKAKHEADLRSCPQ
jgi:hypothetical protein